MNAGIDLASIQRALAAHTPRQRPDVADRRKAAVAAVAREAAGGVELLFIHRAEHPGDPWSGHVAFPGGRVDPGDAGPLAAAVRETREEIGLDLDRDGRLLGRLDETRTHLRPEAVPHSVVPFVYAIDGDPSFTLNHEVQAAFWVPLAFLLDRSNRSSFTWVRRGLPLPMPCYRLGGAVLWGLTLKLVDGLLALLDTG